MVGFFKKFKFQKCIEWPWYGKFMKIGLWTYQIEALNKRFNSVLITPFYVNYNLIYECFRNCMFAKNYSFLHFHRAIIEKLQHIKLWKFAVFYTSSDTSSLPSMNKIRDGRVFLIGSLDMEWPISFIKMAFLSCKRSLEISTRRLTHLFKGQKRPLQSKVSIVATSSADSWKSNIWAFSAIRDFVTDLGIVILPRCTCNHIDTHIITSEALHHVPSLPASGIPNRGPALPWGTAKTS
jgi:hypothetical protein